MFDSGITAKEFITAIKNETDIAPDIEDATWYRLIDEVEQLLYSEIIKEAHSWSGAVNEQGIAEYPIVLEGDAVRFEDIYAVYAGGVQLIKSTPAGGAVFPDCWYKWENNLKINSDKKDYVAYFYVRPNLKTGSGGENQHINLPVEWLPLIGAKVRGEVYKLVGEDTTSAKWLADYNVLVEQFRQYMTLREPDIGVR